MTAFLLDWHPEKAVDGFSAVDGTVMFFSFVRSCCLKTGARDVLDYGAGRGMFWYEDPSEYRKSLRDLRSTVDLGPVQRPERLRLVLRCGFGGGVADEAALVDYPLGDGANTVVVPAEASDCERLVLAIEARSRLGEPALRSEIGRIRVSPLR